MDIVRIGIIGCGAIGSVIAKEMDGKVVALYDVDENRAIKLANSLKFKPKVARTFEEFVSCDIDLVVECASQKAVKEYAERILESGKDLMILSVGALDNSFLERLRSVAIKNGRRIYIPSGAIVGIDGIKAVAGKISEITLTTIKNPKSFGIDADDRRILFEGNAKDAVRMFPQNVNVSATVSLAGVGFERTKVRIIADPSVEENIHEIRVVGEFGEFVTITKNTKLNERTSYLAALSAIRMIKNLEEVVVIGT
jgi:aspartate dehydrogenase